MKAASSPRSRNSEIELSINKLKPPMLLKAMSAAAANVTANSTSGGLPGGLSPGKTGIGGSITHSSVLKPYRKEKKDHVPSADSKISKMKDDGEDGGSSHHSMASVGEESSANSSLVSIKTGCFGWTNTGSTISANRIQMIQVILVRQIVKT